MTERARDALAKRQENAAAPGANGVSIAELIDRQKAQIARALPRHLDADKFARIVLTEVKRTPKLAACTAPSLLGAVMLSAQLGLEPGPLGHCYLVPYRIKGVDTVQFQLGYKGIIDLARRSGQLLSIVARPVYPGDEFEYEYGLDERLVHRPVGDNEHQDATHFYAVAKFKDGGHAFVVLTRSQVETYRKRSPSQRNGVDGPWATDYTAMAAKTAVRRLQPWLPQTIETAQAFEADEQVVHFTGDGVGDISVERVDDEPDAIEATATDGGPQTAGDEPEAPEAGEGPDGEG